MIQQFQDVVWDGLRATLRHWRALLPLYVFGLVLGLLQTWPLFGAASRGVLAPPLVDRLAGGSVDAVIDLFLSDPSTIGATAGGWVAATLLLAFLLGAAYNFFSGGIVSAYLGAVRSFWAACLSTFLSFCGLGMLLIILAALAIGGVLALQGALGQIGALIAALVLIQVINLLGEYARALAVARERRNPFVLLGLAIGFCARHPFGTLALALLGILLNVALALLYRAGVSAIGGTLLAVVLQQLVALAWLWVKLLRLAWAAAYVRAESAGETDPRVELALPAV